MTKKIKFVDFCSGIGAGRLACDNLGFQCMGYSEIDNIAEKTYKAFFDPNNKEKNFDDLMKIKKNSLPDFDLMIGGFPCQSFSIVGKRGGFKDERGQIIFGLLKILKDKDVKYFVLENVKGLVHHEGGKTLEIILEEFDKAGYYVKSAVLNSLNYGVPQMRERIYFVGIKKDIAGKDFKYKFPSPRKTPNIKKYLIDQDDRHIFKKDSAPYKTFIEYLGNKYNKDKYRLEKILKEDYLVLDTRQSDLRLYRGKVPTLRTGRHGIFYIRNGKIRKLSGFESLLLQGFPKKMALKVKDRVPDSKLLSQTGNAMTVTTMQALVSQLFLYLNKNK